MRCVMKKFPRCSLRPPEMQFRSFLKISYRILKCLPSLLGTNYLFANNIMYDFYLITINYFIQYITCVSIGQVIENTRVSQACIKFSVSSNRLCILVQIMAGGGQSYFELKNGAPKMPRLALGTWKVSKKIIIFFFRN